MRIVFVNGSPRHEGNTGTMLRTLAKKAKERGAEVTYYELVDMDVQDCDGCYRCSVDDKCVKDDDMNEVYALIQDADVLVIGSPIYMGAETGITKCFVDRLFYLMAKKRIQPGRRAVALFTCGLMEGHLFYHYMHNRYDKTLHTDLGFEVVNTYILPGTSTKVSLEGNHYARETLKEMEGFIFSDG